MIDLSAALDLENADTAANHNNQIGSDDLDVADLLNQGYVCPADSGPAWRAAHEAGVDMGLIEDSLRLQPLDRLREHQRALSRILSLRTDSTSDDSGSRDTT